MSTLMGPEEIEQLAPSGYYIALRIGFAFPMEEVNAFPAGWVHHYTTQRFMLFDPAVRWAFSNTGMCRWSELPLDDPKRVIAQAKTFGMRFGVTVSVFDGNIDAQRSFASFTRGDREYSDLEVKLLKALLVRRHGETAPPTNLTRAELEALGMVKDGKRLKEIAFELSVSEGAVKQRLKNAKLKLGAKTGTQAAALANQYGLI
ncbi:LuxR family transcriptional regulator [Loktanella sp. D2R18]|uniref:helix-turn-helix transcriptional regulator n=1 Tax=Rhodobacterales TaxID=204455 RepID=UPI000DEAB16B|nr:MULTISPECIES: autoinducer binding domain-containing protein [Rhodobacterales]MDO6589760.1 autoinducer binding domain-containing protein [Yoonia sp. 1_MG-2023]RBW44384.1 LuxR family transcriptional regulator [Loktanella sp. D2R18]